MSERLVIVLLHLAEAGIGDDEVLTFLTALADGAEERAALAGQLRDASPILVGRADPVHLSTVSQWIELLAALEAWHHLRALVRSRQARSRRPRPLRAQP